MQLRPSSIFQIRRMKCINESSVSHVRKTTSHNSKLPLGKQNLAIKIFTNVSTLNVLFLFRVFK